MSRRSKNKESGVSTLTISLVLIVLTSIILMFMLGGNGNDDGNIIKASQGLTDSIINTIKDVNSTNN